MVSPFQSTQIWSISRQNKNGLPVYSGEHLELPIELRYAWLRAVDAAVVCAKWQVEFLSPNRPLQAIALRYIADRPPHALIHHCGGGGVPGALINSSEYILPPASRIESPARRPFANVIRKKRIFFVWNEIATAEKKNENEKRIQRNLKWK